MIITTLINHKHRAQNTASVATSPNCNPNISNEDIIPCSIPTCCMLNNVFTSSQLSLTSDPTALHCEGQHTDLRSLIAHMSYLSQGLFSFSQHQQTSKVWNDCSHCKQAEYLTKDCKAFDWHCILAESRIAKLACMYLRLLGREWRILSRIFLGLVYVFLFE